VVVVFVVVLVLEEEAEPSFPRRKLDWLELIV